jgi:hypothetical protein
VVIGRRGASKLGCLVSLLVVVAIGYFGINVGETYYRFYRFQDAMHQEARFAAHNTDDVIKRRLAAFADSIGLPESARRVNVRRRDRHISIWCEYYDHIELPLYVREVYFNPSIEATF